MLDGAVRRRRVRQQPNAALHNTNCCLSHYVDGEPLRDKIIAIADRRSIRIARAIIGVALRAAIVSLQPVLREIGTGLNNERHTVAAVPHQFQQLITRLFARRSSPVRDDKIVFLMREFPQGVLSIVCQIDVDAKSLQGSSFVKVVFGVIIDPQHD